MQAYTEAWCPPYKTKSAKTQGNSAPEEKHGVLCVLLLPSSRGTLPASPELAEGDGDSQLHVGMIPLAM